MTPRKFNVGIALFTYAGNGSVAQLHPSILTWAMKVQKAIHAHPQIESCREYQYCDTPITMTRNRAVKEAKENGIDILLMVDSDQKPDCELGEDPYAKPFFESSLEFLLRHYDRGPCMIAAPYCGPPPNECVYAFKLTTNESHQPQPNWSIQMYEREEAAIMGGIQTVIAAPTGLTMWDMRIFDLKEPPYFYYEYSDRTHSEKASTEDVVATRDLAFAGCRKLGYNPIYCNWDSWAGHYKPKCVRKPRILTAESVAAAYSDAVHAPVGGAQLMEIGVGGIDGILLGGRKDVPREVLRRAEFVGQRRDAVRREWTKFSHDVDLTAPLDEPPVEIAAGNGQKEPDD